MYTKKCPRCNGTLVKRSGKFGDFFGCANFSRGCKYTEKIAYIKPESVKPDNFTPKIERDWSDYQLAVFYYIKNGFKNNLRVEATAGSGKSTLLAECVNILSALHPTSSIIALVFGKDASKDLKDKIQNADVRTTHSLALMNCRAIYRKINVNAEKYQNIFKFYVENNQGIADTLKLDKSAILRMIDLIRDNMLDCSLESLQVLSDRHGINFNGDTQILVNAITDIYKMGIEDTYNFDFGDLLQVCAKNANICKKYDFILLDESQDTNAAQLALLKNSLKPNGRILFVGDTSQSIYGFRAAMSNAMQILQDSFNADRLPLSISYRCPKSHIAYLKTIPELAGIEIESAPNAIDGILEWGKIDKYLSIIQDKSLVLCRNNAPLVKPAFRLLSEGRKVIIKGKEIGLELINLICKIQEKYNAVSIYDLAESLNSYRQVESEKLLKLNLLRKLDALNDKLDCIDNFIQSSESIDEVIASIDQIFSDDSTDGITFSTVHKAKGLESDEVYILNPELMPNKRAKSDEEKSQEYNIMFVSYTRSKNAMYILSDK